MEAIAANDLDLEAMERTCARLKLPLQDLAAMIGVDQSTLYRWRHGESAPRGLARVRLAQVAELFDLLRQLFDGPTAARRWLLDARPKSLGGVATPLEVMRRGRIDKVISLLDLLAAGG